MESCVSPFLAANEAMSVLLGSALHRSAKSKLRSRVIVPTKERAPLAKTLTDVTCPPQIVGDDMPRSHMTRSDRALREFAEKAAPGRCHTLNEIAEVMGVTRERVRQIEMQAKKTFRNRLTRILKAEGVTPEDITHLISNVNLE